VDENFNGDILKALYALVPDIDAIRVQVTTMNRANDIDILDWAAEERIVLTRPEYHGGIRLR
jgi:hypothetical protein